MGLTRAGIIDSVDGSNYTVSIDMMDGSHIRTAQISSAFFNHVTGGGIIGLPSKGSTVLVNRVDEQDVVVGFIAPGGERLDASGNPIDNDNTDPGYTGSRPRDWLPGDIGIMGSRSNDSFMKVSATGMISIVASELCRMVFLPATENRVVITTDNITWNMGSNVFTVTNSRKTNESSINLDVKTPAGEEGLSVTLTADPTGGAIKVSMFSGTKMEYSSDGSVSIDAAGPISVKSKGNISFNGGNLTIKQ